MGTPACVPFRAHVARQGGVEVRRVSSMPSMRHLARLLRPLLRPLFLEPLSQSVVQAPTPVVARHSGPVATSGAWLGYCSPQEAHVARLLLLRGLSTRHEDLRMVSEIDEAREQVLDT
jgi:hypothetical protein